MSALQPPSPSLQPNQVPDLLGCRDMIANGGFEFDSNYLDEALLTPPDILDYPKLSFEEAAHLSLRDCGEVLDTFDGDLSIEPDWLTESMTLHTPDEQDGDISFSPNNSTSMSLSLSSEDSTPLFSQYNPSTPLYTAHSPLSTAHSPLYTAHSPLSTAPSPLPTSPEVAEVLSMFNDNNCSSIDSMEYLPANEYLPFDQTFEDPVSVYSTPDLTPVPSPLYYCPQDSLDSSDGQSMDSIEQDDTPKRPSKPRRKMTQVAKKERKRLQNKTAALRYRQKKKDEKCGSSSQLDVLESRNAELKKTVGTITAEINYLKKLWSEVRVAKQQEPLSIC